jgi:hypothetical protein
MAALVIIILLGTVAPGPVPVYVWDGQAAHVVEAVVVDGTIELTIQTKDLGSVFLMVNGTLAQVEPLAPDVGCAWIGLDRLVRPDRPRPLMAPLTASGER